MRAAIYCRLSKEDEGAEGAESESIQNQRSMLLQYAAAHGYEVQGVYVDEDYSGADRERPAFNRMLAAAEQGAFEVILAKTQSRFTRDMELVEKYLHGAFPRWGVRFIAVVDQVDTADAAGKKSRQINGLVNEWYLEDLSNNVRSVLTHKRRAGRYIAAFALFGYQKDPADSGHLVIDPAAAAVVRRVFALYLAGSGAARIARLLNQEGMPAPSEYRRRQAAGPAGDSRPGGAVWGKAAVYRMLTNRTYAGDLEQGRHQRVSYKSKQTVWLPRDQWIVVPHTHEPIIDPEQFAQVQRLLARRARSGGGGQVNPLAGRVVCGLCGGGMEQTCSGSAPRGGQGPRRYFRCRMSQRDPRRCPGQPYIPAEDLQRLVLERVRARMAAPLQAALAGGDAPDAADGREQAARREQQRLDREIARRRRALEELYLDKCAGAVSAERYAALDRAFSEQLEGLTARRAALEGQCAPAGAGQALARWLERAAALEAPDRALVSLLVERVVVYPPDSAGARTVEIHWTF